MDGGAILGWTDALGHSFHSIGDRELDGVVVFDYMGSYSEAPRECVVPLDEAINAACDYLEGGNPANVGILLEPD